MKKFCELLKPISRADPLQIFFNFRRLVFLYIRLPRIRIRRALGIDAKIPHVEIHSFITFHFHQRVLSRWQIFNGSEFEPASSSPW